MNEAIQLRMPAYDYPTPAEFAVAGTFVVHLRVVTVLQGVELVQLTAGILAVANRVVASVDADLAFAVTEAFDVGREVQSELYLGHLIEELGLLWG